jgi:hypothetical protein
VSRRGKVLGKIYPALTTELKISGCSGYRIHQIAGHTVDTEHTKFREYSVQCDRSKERNRYRPPKINIYKNRISRTHHIQGT